jgi:hypothetical protein
MTYLKYAVVELIAAVYTFHMETRPSPTSAEIVSLFANSDPAVVWAKALNIIKLVSPGYDSAPVQMVFDDVIRMFRGGYPGYCQIKTLYHDMSHTMDVFLCAVRLMHGIHLHGTRLSDEEITIIIIATLMHDIGYAQRLEEATGTGAQFTASHVGRSINFAQRYLSEKHFPLRVIAAMEPTIIGTNPAVPFTQVHFQNEREHLLGNIVVTSDLTGQMADRTYLEKLLFLFLEFKEAQIGDYRNVHDMLFQTRSFYEKTMHKLNEDLDGSYKNLTYHFKATMGVENNYYLESIDKNIAYLAQIIADDESGDFSMLKRGGIVGKAIPLISPQP